MNTMIFDAHCDTAFELLVQQKDLRKNQLHLDLERMEKYDNYFQVFAAFIDKKGIKEPPITQCLSIFKYINNELQKNGDKIRLICSAIDMENTLKDGKIGAILSIEGAEALQGELSNLLMYHKLGVRLITLTWNYANELADGITEARGGGLTEFGKKAVSMMEKLGIIIDVSHLSVNGFWDVAEITRYPFVASHSCVKRLCNHPRNLDDEQIKLLISRNGCIGINFYPTFLSSSDECGIDEIIRHMEYILDFGGDNSLGFGSDFDGVPQLPNGLSGAENMDELILEMKKRGWSNDLIYNVCFGNFYRIFHDTLAREK